MGFNSDITLDSQDRIEIPFPIEWSMPLFLLVLFCLSLFIVSFEILCDDHWWHIVTGRIIRSTGAIPISDVFSFTFHGKEWVNWEWLFALLISLIWDYSGSVGLILLRFLSLAGILLFTFGHFRDRGGRITSQPLLLLALLTGLLLLAVQFRIADRPHTFSFIFLAGASYINELFHRKPRLSLFMLLLTILVIWRNMHPSWMLGLFLIIATILDLLVPSLKGNAIFSRRNIFLAAALPVAAAAAFFATPFQKGLFGTLLMLNRTRYISEWMSVFNSGFYPSVIAFSLISLLFMIGLIRSVKLKRPFRSMLILMLLVYSILHVRFIAPFAILAVPVIHEWAVSCSGRFSFPPARVYLVSLLIAVLTFTGALRINMAKSNFGVGINKSANPFRLAAFMKERGLGGRVFCSDRHSHNYIIFTLWPAASVYIDGRVPNVYPSEFHWEFITIDSSKKLNEIIERYDIETILFTHNIHSLKHVGMAETLLGERSDFRLLYFFENGALFVKNETMENSCAECISFDIINPWRIGKGWPENVIRTHGFEPFLRELQHLYAVAPDTRMTYELFRLTLRKGSLSPDQEKRIRQGLK